MKPKAIAIGASATTALVVALAVVLSTQPLVANANDVAVPSPKVLVVKFHADWCNSCRALAPKLTDLKNKRDGDRALFVTLDLTNRTTTAHAAMLASALGLSKAYAKNAPKTGFVLVIDAATKKIVSRLDKTQTVAQMNRAIARGLSR